MSKRELTDLTMHLHHETPLAILVSDDGERKNAVWLPKSQCEFVRGKGNTVEVTLPVDLAKEKELI